MNILFSTINYKRSSKFRLLTQIIQDSDSTYVKKTCTDLDSLEHMKKLLINYDIISKELSSFQQPKLLSHTKNSITFDYKNLPSIESLVEDSILFHNESFLETLLTNFYDRLAHLEKVKVIPNDNKAFLDILNSDIDNFGNKVENCYSVGCIDMQASNFLIDISKNEWFIIDQEWLFDFPVPVRYVHLRVIISLSIHLQKVIQTFCSNNLPCLKLSDNLIIPLLFLQCFNLEVDDFVSYYRSYLHYENNFQFYVTGRSSQGTIFNEDECEVIKTSSLNHKYSTKDRNELQNYADKMLEQNTKLENEVERLSNDLKLIQSAKFYTIWQYLNKFKPFN